MTFSNKMEILYLDTLFIQWNNTVYRMNYWVCTAGIYMAMDVLGRVHTTFFTSHQMQEIIYMPEEIILVRMMTALDLVSEKAMYYHNEGYESNNNHEVPPQVTRPIHIYSVSTTEASFDLAEFMTTQCPISPFTPRCPRGLPF